MYIISEYLYTITFIVKYLELGIFFILYDKNNKNKSCDSAVIIRVI